MENFSVVTFYKLVELKGYKEDIQYELKKLSGRFNIKGTILIADEGINATVSGGLDNIEQFCDALITLPQLSDIIFQRSFSDIIPFKKMKVKIKDEIVTFRVKNLDITNAGQYLDSQEWHDLIKDQDILLIDNRNYYEVALGTFKGAINPETYNFSELSAWFDKNLSKVDRNRKIAMFCTGGIRCEKSTAYLKDKGFQNIYHLKGGILKYLKDYKDNDESLWEGKCFVFDDRVYVK